MQRSSSTLRTPAPRALPWRQALGACLLAASAASLAQVPTWKLIGDGVVSSLSADGQAAAGQLPGDYQTFRWTAAKGQQALGRATSAIGLISGWPAISADGKVVASSILDDSGTVGTQGRWTVSGGWQMLRPLPKDAGVMDLEDSGVYGMSRDGKVVTGLYWRLGHPGGNAHGSAWTARKGVRDQGSSGFSSRIDDANEDGSVLVGWDEHPQYGVRRATVWAQGQRQVLEDTDWPSEASAVNAAGTLIVGQANDPSRNLPSATRWTLDAGVWHKEVLGLLPGTQDGGMAYATGVSEDGQVVVGIGRQVFSPQTLGWVWTPSTGLMEAGKFFRKLGLSIPTRYRIFSVSAVSADGLTLAVSVTDSQRANQIRTVLVRLATPLRR